MKSVEHEAGGVGIRSLAFRSPWLWLLLAALAVVSVIGFRGADLAIAAQVRQWMAAYPESGWWLAAHWVGKSGTLAICALITLILWVRAGWFRPDPRLWRNCLWVLAAESANGVAGFILKLVMGRWRPNQPQAGAFEFLQRYNPKCQSFPSGHTADVAAVATVLWFVYPRLRPLYVAWVVVMAAARIGEMRHFLSDTAVGAMLGILCACVVQQHLRRLEGWIWSRWRVRP